MPYEDYRIAQKSGMKAYKSCVMHGKSPYLPALEEILIHAETEHEVHLGISEIPLQYVVGAGTRERAKAFASNFMPLLEYGSEFATKWTHLIDAQLEEGIRDPVKAYEYMNKYYVVEGNKRVSVLKYVGCPSVLADVTRIVPKWSDAPEIRTYYEYMDFYAVTRIDYVHFSSPGSYARLLMVLGKSAEEVWSENERREFSGFYADFEKVFEGAHGKNLEDTAVGDSLLCYLTSYPYQEAKDAVPSQIKANLALPVRTDIKKSIVYLVFILIRIILIRRRTGMEL